MDVTEATDEELAAAAGQGDARAFELLLQRHYNLIFRVAYRFLGAKSEAEDVAQDTAMALADRINLFGGKSRFTTWLYSVTFNACRDHARKRLARERRETRLSEICAETAADWADTDARTRWLYQAVHQLDPTLKETALLIIAEDLTHAEAAEILGVSEGTVSWRVHQIKKRLKMLVGHDE